MENTIGNLIWEYQSVGLYTIKLAGIFPDITKVMVITGQNYAGANDIAYTYNWDGDSWAVETKRNGVPTDQILINTSIEIRIYD